MAKFSIKCVMIEESSTIPASWLFYKMVISDAINTPGGGMESGRDAVNTRAIA